MLCPPHAISSPHKPHFVCWAHAGAPGLWKSLFQHDYIQLQPLLPLPFRLPLTIAQLQRSANPMWQQCSRCVYVHTAKIKKGGNLYLYVLVFKMIMENPIVCTIPAVPDCFVTLFRVLRTGDWHRERQIFAVADDFLQKPGISSPAKLPGC